MCNRLGKKHRQYAGTEGLERLKKECLIRNPKVKLFDTYRVQILLTVTGVMDVYWNPQQKCKSGISKRLTNSKMRHYQKLDRYWLTSMSGKSNL